MSSPRIKKYSSDSISFEFANISHFSLRFEIFADSLSEGLESELSTTSVFSLELLFSLESSMTFSLWLDSSPTVQKGKNSSKTRAIVNFFIG